MTAFLESWGTGISRMVEACKAVGLPEPEYGTDGTFVWITFKRPNSVPNSVPNSDISYNTHRLSDKQKEVLAFCIIARSGREILEHIGVTYQFKNIVKFISFFFIVVHVLLFHRLNPY